MRKFCHHSSLVAMEDTRLYLQIGKDPSGNGSMAATPGRNRGRYIPLFATPFLGT
jgi:hypothetical protein